MKISFKELNVYETEKFHQALLKEVHSSKTSLTLNFSNVQKIDFINIQLILSLKKFCDEQNIKLKLTSIKSRQVKQIFTLFNLYEILGIQK